MGRRGPTPQGEYAGKTEVFSTRIRPDLRASIEKAAQASGRSISQEVEHRLRRTFIQDDRIEDAFGSRENYTVLRIVGLAMQYARVPFHGTPDWRSDPLAFDVVVRTVNRVLEAIRPPGGRPGDVFTETAGDFVSEQVPAAIWQAIQGADPALPLDKGTRDDHLAGLLKIDLGEIADRPQLRIQNEDDLRRMAEARGWTQANAEPAGEPKRRKPRKTGAAGKRQEEGE